MDLKTLATLFPKPLYEFVLKNENTIQELRLRAGRPVCVVENCTSYYLGTDGLLKDNCLNTVNMTYSDIERFFRLICDNSLHTYQQQISMGYVTLSDGNRVGIGGTAVYNNGRIDNIRDINSLSIRIMREYKGCADKIMPYVYDNNRINSVIIAAPPMMGKTTLLRDIARQLSVFKKKVCVVDLKNEIAGTNCGRTSFEVGMNTDVLSGFEKSDGIRFAVENLSAQVVICDEINAETEFERMYSICNMGVPVIFSTHAYDATELVRRAAAKKLILCGAKGYIAVINKDIGKLSSITEWGNIKC